MAASSPARQSPVPKSTSPEDKKEKSDTPSRAPKHTRSPGTPRAIRVREEKFTKSAENRSGSSGRSKNKDDGPGIGPVVLAFILFVVLGSAVLQILRGF